MIFNNVVLYCKMWYKQSDEVWKDLARCIAVDYMITLTTEQEVVDWLLFIMDDNLDIYKNSNGRFSIRYVLTEVYRLINEDKLSYNKAVINFFIDETSRICPLDCSKIYKPDDRVLPFNYITSYIDGNDSVIINGVKYNRRWHPSEMREDVLKRINETFGNGEEQENIPINIV